MYVSLQVGTYIHTHKCRELWRPEDSGLLELEAVVLLQEWYVFLNLSLSHLSSFHLTPTSVNIHSHSSPAL